jgi:hypothetical protein
MGEHEIRSGGMGSLETIIPSLLVMGVLLVTAIPISIPIPIMTAVWWWRWPGRQVGTAPELGAVDEGLKRAHIHMSSQGCATAWRRRFGPHMCVLYLQDGVNVCDGMVSLGLHIGIFWGSGGSGWWRLNGGQVRWNHIGMKGLGCPLTRLIPITAEGSGSIQNVGDGFRR